MKYNNIYKKICTSEKFKCLANEIHHGSDRLSHTIRVAKLSFFVSKMLNCDIASTTRGALLHDFFLSEDFHNPKNHLKSHPYIALHNSKEEFCLNEKEEDIIKTHMFPLTKTLPQYKESYIVSLCDKFVSIYEFLRYQIKYTTYVMIIFVAQMLNNY